MAEPTGGVDAWQAEPDGDPWRWVYEGYDPGQEGLREALCTLGNGYFATRGAAPEARADGIHYPGTYVAGLYNRLTNVVEGVEVENESLVNLPNWLPLTFRIDGGAWYHPGAVSYQEHRTELDLRRAVLTRRLRMVDGAGRQTTLTERRFVHRRSPHLAGLETTLRAENWSGPLTIRSGLDASVRNRGVERYRGLDDAHLDLVRMEAPTPDTVALEVRTTQSHVLVAEAARSRLLRDGLPAEAERRLVVGQEDIAHEVTVDLAEGASVTVEKVVALHTGRDPAISEPFLAAVEAVGQAPPFDQLLERHVLAWDHSRHRFSVTVHDGGEERRILDLHLFHLLQTVSRHTVDLDVGVPARGWHGEAYRGHIFWDELFIIPLLAFRHPSLARSLLLYRYRRLDEARRAAVEEGLEGAMFPWQSGSTGREESQRLHLNPVSGRWVPDESRLQRHIGAAVAYNVWHYVQTTADLEFLGFYGAEMLVEIARLWASMAGYDRARDRYVIRGVMGPDEFHDAYPGHEGGGVDNNAYTNVMAVWCLLRAQDALEHLPAYRRAELWENLGLRREELDRWQDIARRMFVPFQRDGIISQFEGYEHLEELDWEGYRARYGDVQRLDRILEAEGDTPNRYKASKQADVLMLFYLLSGSELEDLLAGMGYEWDRSRIPATVDYYMGRTSHGSTLSSVVHSWVLARSDRERSWELFQQALRSDVADVQGGTTREGIHLGAMAGTVDLLLRCYAGLETRADRLLFDPALPEELGGLSFNLIYRGGWIDVQVDRRRLVLERRAGGEDGVRVVVRGAALELPPGSREEVTW